MNPKKWERIIIKGRKSYIGGGSKLAGKKGQFSMGIFNKDIMLFNVQNGTIDLRTGKLKPHEKTNYPTLPLTSDNKI